MAVNSSRSQTKALLEGTTDGKYRKVRPDTEIVPGNGTEITVQNRAGLHPWMNYDYITEELPAAQRVSPGA